MLVLRGISSHFSNHPVRMILDPKYDSRRICSKVSGPKGRNPEPEIRLVCLPVFSLT